MLSTNAASSGIPVVKTEGKPREEKMKTERVAKVK